MNICKAFQLDDPNEAYNQMKLHFVEDYGDYAYGNYLHTWDDGWRYLCQCACGGYVLVQKSVYISPDWDDNKESEYTDYFPVSGPEEADELNRKYDGYALEMSFPGKYLCVTNGKVHWANNGNSEAEKEPEVVEKSAITENRIFIKRPIREEVFQPIAERIRNLRDDPDDFLILDLEDDPDMLFMQTVRCGDQWHVELAFDMDEYGWEHPLILGSELPLDEAVSLLHSFIVEGKTTDDLSTEISSFRNMGFGKKPENDNAEYHGNLETCGSSKIVKVYEEKKNAAYVKYYDVCSKMWHYQDKESYLDLFESEMMLSVMRELTQEEAEEITETDLNLPAPVEQVLISWHEKKKTFWDEWEHAWPAKSVKVIFSYGERQFFITPGMLGLDPYEPYDNGFLEHITAELRKDMESAGAEYVGSLGFLD